MSSAAIAVSVLRFGAFELDLRANELRRAGVLIKLSPQQFRVLKLLVENSGRICTREEFQREIWGTDVFVDFERGLNVSIAQIRAALNDDAEAPRFIQTVPRKGYRFLAPVEQLGLPAPVVQANPGPPAGRRMPAIAAAVFVTAGLCAAVGAYLWHGRTVTQRTVLAVLPFQNLTRVPGDAVILDGLLDELITQFATISPGRLAVIGRTSVERYAVGRTALPQIGRELGSSLVVEGGLRREASRVRITARLVDVNHQSQVWNEIYEGDGASLLELQEGIAARVTAAVVRQMFPESSAGRRQAHVPNRGAYESWTAGRYLRRKHTRADAQRAIAEFEEAGKRDPGFAQPWADIAQVSVGLAMSGGAPAPEAFETARQAAERALQIDENNAPGHGALASVLLWRDWNWQESGRHFARATALNPSDAQIQHDYAFYLVALGHPEQGLALLRRAIALDPLSPQVNIDAGWVFLQAHHFKEAIAQAKRALELEPGLAEASACIARAEQYQGHASPATLDFYRSRIQNPERMDPYGQALAFAVLGRKDEALAALQSAYSQHSMLMPMLNTEPAFSFLHTDRRFQDLLTKLGIPASGGL